MSLLKKQKIRLLGINTPEVRGSEKSQGIISRDALRQRILGKVVIIKTSKDKKGKYGRWLGEVFGCLSGAGLGMGAILNCLYQKIAHVRL